ncbi:hypothetical protein ACFTRD_25835 [Paenibacillus sp. NPDC056933]|uniref:hypothetical protein n=1 Tax=Paenibacillus sp. NPDC056933 TaxID=3345968 RepID=UPI003629843D
MAENEALQHSGDDLIQVGLHFTLYQEKLVESQQGAVAGLELLLGIKGMLRNKLRVNAGFTKVMRFSMKFAPDYITHTWGQMILKQGKQGVRLMILV